MPTIYLDTSHFSILERLSVTDPPRFSRFVQFWRGAGAELVFSKNHLIELRRHDDPAVRQRRYRLVQELAPVHTDVEPLQAPYVRTPRAVSREIISALDGAGLVTLSDLSAEQRRFVTEILPFRHATAGEVTYLTGYEDLTFGSRVKRAREVTAFEIQNRERSPGTKFSPPRIDQVSGTPLTSDEVADRLAALDDALKDPEILASYRSFWPQASDQEIRNRLKPGMEQFIKRTGEISPESAWLELQGIESRGPRDKRRLDVAAQDQAFTEEIEIALREHLEIDDQAVIERAQETITLENCPGMWLVRAVERELVGGTPVPAPSDADDLEHLIYLPYVDVFFADKRITDFATRVLSRPGIPSSVALLKPPLKVARDVEALEAALGRAIGRTS